MIGTRVAFGGAFGPHEGSRTPPDKAPECSNADTQKEECEDTRGNSSARCHSYQCRALSLCNQLDVSTFLVCKRESAWRDSFV
jgi:hypothetical protein